MAQQQELDFTEADRLGWIEGAAWPNVSVTRQARLKALLLKIYFFSIKRGYAWVGEETLQKEMGFSDRTIRTYLTLAKDLNLIIVERAGRNNRYTIVWGELKSAADRTADMQNTGSTFRYDTGNTGSTFRCNTGNTGSRFRNQAGSETVDSGITFQDSGITFQDSGITFRLTKEQKNHSHTGESNGPGGVEATTASLTWDVVVSELELLEVKDVERAVATARDRGLAPGDAWELIERYRERLVHSDQSGDKPITPGWLHRWLTGKSAPDPVHRDPPAQRSSLRGDALSRDESRRMCIRAGIVQLGRARGWTEDEMRRRCEVAGVAYD